MNVPVLIIGAGPSGATAALHLGRLGIKTLVISRHRGTANTPRAHIFNQRAMEVLRDAGIEGRCYETGSSMEYMAHSSFLDKLTGQEYGRLWAWGNKPKQKGDYEVASPCKMSDLPQSHLEPILVEEAEKLGAEFRFYTEFVSVSQDSSGVSTLLRNRNTGETYTVYSSYLIGADGARSAVVKALEIPISGKQINTAFNVHIEADLTKYIAHRPGSLNWILNPEAPDWSAVGNFRMVRPWHEWVVSMHPATKNGNRFEPTQQDIVRRLHQMIGDDTVSIKILSTFEWTINDQVANYWQKDRILCIGDAVHRHPPINGLGSNTCLSDAFNIAWKIAYVLKGIAKPALLETLTAERKPVGDAIVRRASTGMEAHRTLWSIIKLTQKDRAEALALLGEDSIAGRQKREDWTNALEAIDAEVQALGIQMNQVYLDSAGTAVEPDDLVPDFSSVDTIKEQMISTYPGYHLPHVWLAKDGQSMRKSTLDLAGQGRFALFTGNGGDCWINAARALITSSWGIDIVGYKIGFGGDYMDCYREWAKVRGVEEDGVVLVRPDHFVAWRYPRRSDRADILLRNILERVLCF
ncbi:FAD binding domain-containing protein [Aspergillus pseudocaelatus]|uniref:FAD binding domain-containing protein n=1 Tax=Aspergillus pseudocaelatus TaxID=1825620 RepID=A0ABQ6WUK9_9EURO|nr:FAD binding domain-containing protein [Aspergillus pseudocaelatus]